MLGQYHIQLQKAYTAERKPKQDAPANEKKLAEAGHSDEKTKLSGSVSLSTSRRGWRPPTQTSPQHLETGCKTLRHIEARKARSPKHASLSFNENLWHHKPSQGIQCHPQLPNKERTMQGLSKYQLRRSKILVTPDHTIEFALTRLTISGKIT